MLAVLVFCRYVRPRLALIGDAAHTVHPLAGQGVNLGFGDVKALLDAIAYATETGTDIGNIALLEVYATPPIVLADSLCSLLSQAKQHPVKAFAIKELISTIGIRSYHEQEGVSNKYQEHRRSTTYVYCRIGMNAQGKEQTSV